MIQQLKEIKAMLDILEAQYAEAQLRIKNVLAESGVTPAMQDAEKKAVRSETPTEEPPELVLLRKNLDALIAQIPMDGKRISSNKSLSQ